MPRKRGETRILPETTFSGSPSVVTYELDVGGASQIAVCLTHAEGTSATALTYKIDLIADIDSTSGLAVSGLYASNPAFPYSEEIVGTTTSGITSVTVNASERSFPSDYLDSDLPIVFLPVVATFQKYRITLTETASAAGSIKGFAILDYQG